VTGAATAVRTTSGTGHVTTNTLLACSSVCVESTAAATGALTVHDNTMTLSAGARAVAQDDSSATVTMTVTDNVIEGLAGAAFGIAIAANDGGHVVRNNTVSTVFEPTSGPTDGNYAVRISAGAGAVIEDNQLGYTQAGVWLRDNAAGSTVRNNVITGRYAVVITNAGPGTNDHSLFQNAVTGRVGVYLDGDLGLEIFNNILYAADTAEHGIFVSAVAATPASVANNDIFGFPAVYRSAAADECNAGNDCSLVEMEAATSLTASGNIETDPTFVLPGGFDGSPMTLPLQDSDDYSLAAGASCEVVEGGRDGSAWGFSDDLAGATRTATLTCSPSNAGAGGWSMGAYERD
jgi:hypothetical protein